MTADPPESAPDDDDRAVDKAICDDLDSLMQEAALAGWSREDFTQAVFEQSLLVAWRRRGDDD